MGWVGTQLVVIPFKVDPPLFMPIVEATTTWGPPAMEPTTEVGAAEELGPEPEAAGIPPASSNRRSSGRLSLSALILLRYSEKDNQVMRMLCLKKIDKISMKRTKKLL